MSRRRGVSDRTAWKTSARVNCVNNLSSPMMIGSKSSADMERAIGNCLKARSSNSLISVDFRGSGGGCFDSETFLHKEMRYCSTSFSCISRDSPVGSIDLTAVIIEALVRSTWFKEDRNQTIALDVILVVKDDSIIQKGETIVFAVIQDLNRFLQFCYRTLFSYVSVNCFSRQKAN